MDCFITQVIEWVYKDRTPLSTLKGDTIPAYIGPRSHFLLEKTQDLNGLVATIFLSKWIVL